jgi:hypothetical protein
MIDLFRLTVTVAFCCSAVAATLNHHPHWKSDRLPDLYYEVLIRALEQEGPLQAEDGRFRSRMPQPGDDEMSWRVVGLQFIYAPALLYVSEHPAVVQKWGPWVYSISALISPERPFHRMAQ